MYQRGCVWEGRSMGIREWLGLGSKGCREKPAPVLQVEQLEPRLLLSADPVGREIIPAVGDYLAQSVITVDLSPGVSEAEGYEDPPIMTVSIPEEGVCNEHDAGEDVTKVLASIESF